MNRTLVLFLLVMFSCKSLQKSDLDSFCNCKNRKEYKYSGVHNYSVIIFDNGDSLCGPIFREDRKTSFNNKLNFVFKTYYYNDTLKSKTTVKNGKFDGESLDYYDYGKLLSMGNYREGKVYGKDIYYHKNGKIKEFGYYYNSIKVGKWCEYDTSGHLTKETIYGK